jgi:hypothetical protein
MTKRDMHLERRRMVKHLRRQSRRCFWTWPFGHDYSLSTNGIPVCRYCYWPEKWLGHTRSQRFEELKASYRLSTRDEV